MALFCSVLFLVPTLAQLGAPQLAQVAALRTVVDRNIALGETESANRALEALTNLTAPGTVRWHMVNMYLASYLVALVQLALLCWANLSETLLSTENALEEANRAIIIHQKQS